MGTYIKRTGLRAASVSAVKSHNAGRTFANPLNPYFGFLNS
jgi:hypothetical protein